MISDMRGSNSQTPTPGRLEAIGLNSPRSSAGASGFMSKVSCCGTPPNWCRKITDLARTFRPELRLGPQGRGQAQSQRAQRADLQHLAARERGAIKIGTSPSFAHLFISPRLGFAIRFPILYNNRRRSNSSAASLPASVSQTVEPASLATTAEAAESL